MQLVSDEHCWQYMEQFLQLRDITTTPLVTVETDVKKVLTGHSFRQYPFHSYIVQTGFGTH